VVIFDKNGALHGQFPEGWYLQYGRCGAADSERADRARDHPRRPPEENHEQCTSDASANFGQPVRRLPRLV